MVGNLRAYLILTWLAKRVGGPWVLLIGLPALGALITYGAMRMPVIIKMRDDDDE